MHRENYDTLLAEFLKEFAEAVRSGIASPLRRPEQIVLQMFVDFLKRRAS